MTIDDNHPYAPASPGDSRSPCPALNALANHGYLPHDGRNLTVSQLIAAVHHVYGLSFPLATLLSLGGVAKCGHWAGLHMVLDLHELARHNVIEHDGSLVHADTAPGERFAPTAVDPVLLRHLLATSGGDSDVLTRRDLCRAQLTRHAASRPLNATQAFVSKGELDLIHEVFGVRVSALDAATSTPASEAAGTEVQAGSPAAAVAAAAVPTTTDSEELVVPKAYLEEWLGHERLPREWAGPVREVGLLGLVAHVREIARVESDLVLSGKATAAV
ncbi:Cloroperoxidase [Daedaleopsis nitida]|nr:Cloroperoxidase [Daedaleopsis nitida]